MEKTKILILMVEQWQHEGMLARELKELTETYEVVLAHSIVDALAKIASASLIEKNPICGLVFERNTLASNRGRCRVVREFAEECCDKLVTAINMINNDQDNEARSQAVSADYCRINDWAQVKNIFDNHFKK